MEFSSPLQARWGCRRGSVRSRKQLNAGGQVNFAARLTKPTDYFSVSYANSSPSTCLAMDMSTNLTVDGGDSGNQFVTPRRSLFKSFCSNAEGTITPPCEGATTPIILSSSPGLDDPMDVTPLPHKTPIALITETPPTPMLTTLDDDMLSPHSIPESSPAELLEKKPTIIRPSLARTKNLSTNTVSIQPKEQNILPAFSFGATSTGFIRQSPGLLDDALSESPVNSSPQPDRSPSYPTITFPRSRPSCLLCNNRGSCPRCSGPIRKPAGPFSRRPSKFRRSLSMFENPGDIMRQDKEDYKPSSLQSVMDVDDAPKLALPHFIPHDEPDGLPRINASTLVELLDGTYDEHFQEKIIVDCRFEYEFDAGHILGAINYCDRERLSEKLFGEQRSIASKAVLIFHCEFSAHRAPLMAKFVRQSDRAVNQERYPDLTFPEVYILDGGYSSFFTSHRSRCFPQNYLKMDSKDHEHACEQGMHKLRHRSKLNRAQTFAFGQGDYSQVDDSPTNQGRSKSSFQTLSSLRGGISVSDDFSLSNGRLGARRLPSY